MEGRINEETGIFEIVVNHKWIILNDEIWSFAQEEISNGFLMTIYHNADSIFKQKAFCEFKRRIKCNFNLKLLWEFFLGNDRLLGNLALDEIVRRTGKYTLPQYCDK